MVGLNQIIAGAALTAFVALGGGLYVQTQRLDASKAREASLARSVKALEVQAAQSALAADVAAARAKRAQDMNAEATAQIEAILNLNLGDCANETLDSDLTDILGRRFLPASD